LLATPHGGGGPGRAEKGCARARPPQPLFTAQQNEGQTHDYVVKDRQLSAITASTEQQRYVRRPDGRHPHARRDSEGLRGTVSAGAPVVGANWKFFVAQLLRRPGSERVAAGRAAAVRARQPSTVANSCRRPCSTSSRSTAISDPDRLLIGLPAVDALLVGWPCPLLGLGTMLAALAVLATHWGDSWPPAGRPWFFASDGPLSCGWPSAWSRSCTSWATASAARRSAVPRPRLWARACCFFAPSLYCDVSDSWTWPAKWQRIAISPQHLCPSSCSPAWLPFVWWGTDAGTLPHQLCSLCRVQLFNTLLLNVHPAAAGRLLHSCRELAGNPQPVHGGAAWSVGACCLAGCAGAVEDRPRRFGRLLSLQRGQLRLPLGSGDRLFWALFHVPETSQSSARSATSWDGRPWRRCSAGRCTVCCGPIHRQGRLPDMKAARLWWSALAARSGGDLRHSLPGAAPVCGAAASGAGSGPAPRRAGNWAVSSNRCWCATASVCVPATWWQSHQSGAGNQARSTRPTRPCVSSRRRPSRLA